MGAGQYLSLIVSDAIVQHCAAQVWRIHRSCLHPPRQFCNELLQIWFNAHLAVAGLRTSVDSSGSNQCVTSWCSNLKACVCDDFWPEADSVAGGVGFFSGRDVFRPGELARSGRELLQLYQCQFFRLHAGVCDPRTSGKFWRPGRCFAACDIASMQDKFRQAFAIRNPLPRYGFLAGGPRSGIPQAAWFRRGWVREALRWRCVWL